MHEMRRPPSHGLRWLTAILLTCGLFTGCHNGTLQMPTFGSSAQRVPPPGTGSYAIPGQTYNGQMGVGTPAPSAVGANPSATGVIPASSAGPLTTNNTPPATNGTVATVAGTTVPGATSVSNADYNWVTVSSTSTNSALPAANATAGAASLGSNVPPTTPSAPAPADSAQPVSTTLPWRAPGAP
jgi:hypothetical protein